MIVLDDINTLVSHFENRPPLSLPIIHRNGAKYEDLTNMSDHKTPLDVPHLLRNFLMELEYNLVTDENKFKLRRMSHAYLNADPYGFLKKIVNFILHFFGSVTFRDKLENLDEAIEILASPGPSKWIPLLVNPKASIGMEIDSEIYSAFVIATSEIQEDPHFQYLMLGNRPSFSHFNDEMKEKGLPEISPENCIAIFLENRENPKEELLIKEYIEDATLYHYATPYMLSLDQQKQLRSSCILPDDLITLLTHGIQS